MMDSWKYLSEQKGVFTSEELHFPFDVNINGSDCNENNNVVYSIENHPPFVSNARAFDRLDLMEMCFADNIRKPSCSDEPGGEVFSTGTGTDSWGNVTTSPFCDEEKDSGCLSLSDYVQSKTRGLSLIDLKLGGLDVDGNVHVSSGLMSDSVKRARFGTAPCCQVFGCNKDLSLYKGYYKRHKVCDVHTKTAKVVIEGIEQRFCQQCSRFHLLAEFDDGKRSCRRRLAAHNKRRRKPQHACISGEGTGNMVNVMEENILDHESLSIIRQTSSALSLLSAQSHNTRSQLHGAAISSPLISKSNLANSEKMAQSGSHAPEVYLVGGNHVKPTIINHYGEANSAIDLKFQDDDLSVGPCLRSNNTGYHNNPVGRGIILDLLQLSSHLQRIEHQKHSTESGAG